jgi:hypothetical protein
MKNNFAIIVAKVNRSLVAFCVKNNSEFLFARRIKLPENSYIVQLISLF